MDHLFVLHEDLKQKRYEHGGYQAFKISDPKPRDIHKASVRDRLVHHAIYRILYPFFDTLFIADSYSCRKEKGTHKALNRFRIFGSKASKNHTKTAWVLKCDVRKFFASIDQEVLIRILHERIPDQEILWLLEKVIRSFHSDVISVLQSADKHPAGIQNSWIPGRARDDKTNDLLIRRGLPLGNLTSQLLVNIYMNEFDQFMKHRLKAKYYIRYADDFVIFSRDKVWLECVLIEIDRFLDEQLHLKLHPDKVSIQAAASGVNFLGWVHFPDHRVLRGATKRRMFRKVCEKNAASYIGLLSHGNGYGLKRMLEGRFGVE
jgi:retron-type reverse transcriptase